MSGYAEFVKEIHFVRHYLLTGKTDESYDIGDVIHAFDNITSSFEWTLRELETLLNAAWKFEQEMSGGEFVHFGEFRRALVAASGEDRAAGLSRLTSNPATKPVPWDDPEVWAKRAVEAEDKLRMLANDPGIPPDSPYLAEVREFLSASSPATGEAGAVTPSSVDEPSLVKPAPSPVTFPATEEADARTSSGGAGAGISPVSSSDKPMTFRQVEHAEGRGPDLSNPAIERHDVQNIEAKTVGNAAWASKDVYPAIEPDAPGSGVADGPAPAPRLIAVAGCECEGCQAIRAMYAALEQHAPDPASVPENEA